MNGDALADGIMDSEYPSGPVLVHVVDYDHEYWLEVAEVRTTTLIETGWVNGTVIETRPIAEGVRARKEVFTPRPYFRPEFIAPPEGPVELPTEFRDPEPETESAPDPRSDLPPFQSLVGKEVTIRIPITSQEIELKGKSLDAPERFELLPGGEISGELHMTPNPLFGRLIDGELKSEVIRPPLQPIVGRTLHDADPNIPDLSEPHYWTYESEQGPEFQNPAANTPDNTTEE